MNDSCRRLALRAATVGAPLWAVWSGCGDGEERGTKGTDGADATDSASDTPADVADAAGETIDSGAPYPGAEPCAWPGWYRAPALPKGCRTVCIPDDIGKRVPALEWVSRDDWCPGCKWLAPGAWPGAHAAGELVDQGVLALGANPDLVNLSFRLADQNLAQAMYDAAGQPRQASRFDIHAPSCGWAGFPVGQDVNAVGARYDIPGQPLRWFFRPRDRVDELMLATEPDYVYGSDFAGGANGGNSFTSRWLVDEFYSFLSLVDLETKKAVKIEALPGAPPGEYSERVIVGDAIFFSRFWNMKTDWWVIPDAKNPNIQPFLGAADVEINDFAANEDWIVWNEGSAFEPDAGTGYVQPQKYDLYRSPFTTDANKLERQLLVPNTHQFYGVSTFANGFYTPLFFLDDSLMQSSVYVVEVATGRAWISTLPGNYYWGRGSYPTATELWGTVMPNLYLVQGASEVVRVPYATMQQVQSSPP